jgi:hypothetical protein
MMARTKSFQDLVHGQAKTDKKFAEAPLREGIDAMLSGDMETGKTILRDTIKATMGFEKLGEATGAAQEPDPHVRPSRQSASQEPIQRHRLFAETGRTAASCYGVVWWCWQSETDSVRWLYETRIR